MKIKVITLNLLHGGELMDNILEFIKKEDPDILMCQEVNNGDITGVPRALTTLKVFSEIFDYSDVFSPQILWIKEPGVEQGVATFSRLPISLQETIFFDNGYTYYPMDPNRTDWQDYPSCLQRVIVDYPTGAINIINIHGIWGFDGRDSARRDIMVDKITQQAEGKSRVVLAGDFNMNPDTNSIQRLERHVKNVFKNELITSFNSKRKPKGGGWSTAVVDMMFVSNDIKIIDHYMPEVDVSDHMPLVAVLEV